MIGWKDRQKRAQMIRGVALVLICAALALVPYFYRLELQARIEPGPQADAQVPPSPAETPGSGSERPGPVEGLQLDAPGPEDPPGGSLEVVDGDDLFALVTKQTTLGQYKPHDLEVIPERMIHPDQRQWPYLLRREPLEQLTKMWEAAEADGVLLTVTSAYRDYATQERLFNEYAAAYGEEEASTFSARPGQSEHQLGTTLDFDPRGGKAGWDWLEENAHHYGFALSYPDAQAITGYIEEPWHYRYIGVAAAREWKESGLVLCEYLKLLQHRSAQQPVFNSSILKDPFR
jgi:D-alanyl-D-alanine carboxypeptidase